MPTSNAEINKKFMHLSRRAESADRAMLVETFVDVGSLLTLLSSHDHQIVYGRRGTGKTHAFLYLDNTERRNSNLSVYIDMRTVGSTGGLYSDQSLPLTERATRLLMDTLSALHNSLLEQIIDHASIALEHVGPIMDRLAEAITEVAVVGNIQTEETTNESTNIASRQNSGATVGSSPSATLASERSRTENHQSGSRVARSGVLQHRVHFGRVGAAFGELMTAIRPLRLWVLVDEWSDVPIELQPFLAELLRRSLFPVERLTVKIGCIEQRTNFQVIRQVGDYVGIELGADAAADINLDDFMVFENDPEGATTFFRELLFKHIKAIDGEAEQEIRNASELIALSFTQRNTFEEFVRAAEGVPRDAINILSLCAQRARDGSISMEHVRSSAKSWYLRDKEAAVSANSAARALLHWITDKVIAHRRARGFLLKTGERHPLIDALFDSRVLHVLKRNISSHDEPGVRYDAFKIDYGCYVDLLSTARTPLGLFEIGEENEDQSFAEVPPDDYRAIRRATLDIAAFERSTQ